MRVSVLIKAYNHEPFIARAVESAAAQQTSFPYEIVVGEDCSRDATRTVLQALQARFPDRVRLLVRARNLGNLRNLIETLAACRGEYVALLDGDDFWTSPLKLQRQVDFLDAHPMYASAAHNATVVDESGGRVLRTYRRRRRSETIALRRMLVSDPVPTSSVVFRRGLFAAFPPWFDTVLVGDWPLHVLNLRYGPMHYDGAVMSAYRLHPGGLWSRSGPVRARLARIAIYRHLNEELGGAHEDLIRRRIARQYVALAEHHRQRGERTQMRDSLRQAWRAAPWHPRLFLRGSVLRGIPDLLRAAVASER